MKNIHVLPTDKPSRLYYNSNQKHYRFNFNVIRSSNCIENQNIYITSDEEIKEGDYVTNGKYISKAVNEWWTKFYIGNPNLKADYWKIILTTDQDLIKDGVQAIDDEFLEWFIKNPSCEYVEVEKMFNVVQFTSREFIYKIIIPKEEPFRHKCRVLSTEEVLANRSSAYEFIDFDKQETLEEVANEYAKNRYSPEQGFPEEDYYISFLSFRAGAKWQQEQYKKIYSHLVDLLEELKPIYREDSYSYKNCELERLEIIKQFKNK